MNRILVTGASGNVICESMWRFCSLKPRMAAVMISEVSS
jgi:hypothetical protein